MKNKIAKILLLFFFVISITGCTTYIKTDEGKSVKSEVTGQNITKNILCRPTDSDTLKIYEKNEIDISKLPECEEMKVTSGGYEGLWTSVFVKPLAFFIMTLTKLVGYSGLALILAAIIIRSLLYPITKKTAMQSELLKKAKPEMDKIEKKYSGKTEKENMMKKSQEMMLIYKKYKINPALGCVYAFLQMPLLFAFLEAINRTPAIFEEKFLGLQLGTTPWIAISNGQFYYIILVALIGGATYFSFKLNATTASSEQANQMKMMSNIMMVFIIIMSFQLSSAIGLYWLTTSLFTIGQNLLVKKRTDVNEIK